MFSGLFKGADISASGMAAERVRMDVVANNIANAHTTRSEEGGPYQRKYVVFAEALGDSAQQNSQSMNGVSVVGIQGDTSSFEEVYDPGHPDRDRETNMVLMPNVKMPNEMIDLITASRSYEANLKALSMFKDMVEQTLSLLRGNR